MNIKDEIFHELMKNLRIDISDEQIPYEYGKRIVVKLEYHKDGKWQEITSDFIEIRKSDLE